MDARSTHALIRFGFGRRGAEPLPADPVAWLHAQLEGPDPARFPDPPSTAKGLTAELQDRAARRGAANAPMASPAMANAGMAAPEPDRSPVRTLFRAETGALLDHAITTDAAFRERLVWFWANHFTVSQRRAPAVPVIGAFVQEAIRPHVTGRFVDMLQAVMRHPAMLFFLDNVQSIGPDSQAARADRAKPGSNPPRGLNENLARECLELHTISPAAGYSQADVTNFARILTGWSVDFQQTPPAYRFRPFWHEPGTIRVMGQDYPAGEAGGIAALIWLGTHPATYRHLATSLARHFIADDPPADAVAAIAAALASSGGDLAAAARAVVARPEAWQPLTKLRRPQEFVLAALRAVDLPADKRPNLMAVLNGLGQGMFNAPAPNGWSDRAEAWAAPEAMMRRMDWSHSLARRADNIDPIALAEANLGPLLSADTAAAIRGAGSRRDALTLLLASPEFQRR